MLFIFSEFSTLKKDKKIYKYNNKTPQKQTKTNKKARVNQDKNRKQEVSHRKTHKIPSSRLFAQSYLLKITVVLPAMCVAQLLLFMPRKLLHADRLDSSQLLVRGIGFPGDLPANTVPRLVWYPLLNLSCLLQSAPSEHVQQTSKTWGILKFHNHRAVWIGRDLRDQLVPIPCHGQGTLS